MKKIDLMIECQECGGTVVYQGMGERDGAAVVCTTCNGTGKEHYVFEYNEFSKRKERKDVKRVYRSGYGYCIAPKPITLSNGTFVDFSKEGVSYQEFLDGKYPDHIKRIACPMIADQSKCHGIKGFTDRCNELNGGWLSYIPECNCKEKMKCWELFENGNK